MTQEEFDDCRAELAAEAERIAVGKRPAYTQANKDVLHNFKSGAQHAGVTPLQGWAVLVWKHMAAVLAYAKNPEGPQGEPILGRFADAKNYLDLGFALVTEDAEQRQGGR